jgi:hypothetical protein
MEDLVYVPTKRFVYFNDAGDLLSISNTRSEEGNFIEVAHANVINLVSGKEHLHQYWVIFDTITKTYRLEHRSITETLSIDVNSQIHYIERGLVPSVDLKIIQDIPQAEWVLQINNAVSNNFNKKNVSVDATLMFSITRYNDLHCLEKVISIQLADLIHSKCVKIPFDSQIELDPEALSVYTIKRFHSYHHEVINE